METPKKSENIKTAVDRQDVINALKADKENEATVILLTKWHEQEQQKFNGPDKTYDVDWSFVDLYIEAECYQEAYRKLDEILDVTDQDHNQVQRDKANQKMDQIDVLIKNSPQ
jgi:hypothetical protein